MTDTTLPITAIDLRDYFAAKALPIVYDDWATALGKEGEIIDMEKSRQNIANECYKFADAMLKARGIT